MKNSLWVKVVSALVATACIGTAGIAEADNSQEVEKAAGVDSVVEETTEQSTDAITSEPVSVEDVLGEEFEPSVEEMLDFEIGGEDGAAEEMILGDLDVTWVPSEEDAEVYEPEVEVVEEPIVETVEQTAGYVKLDEGTALYADRALDRAIGEVRTAGVIYAEIDEVLDDGILCRVSFAAPEGNGTETAWVKLGQVAWAESLDEAAAIALTAEAPEAAEPEVEEADPAEEAEPEAGENKPESVDAEPEEGEDAEPEEGEDAEPEDGEDAEPEEGEAAEPEEGEDGEVPEDGEAVEPEDGEGAEAPEAMDATIAVLMSWEGDTLEYGSVITLTAQVDGVDGVYDIFWECDRGAGWELIPGEQGGQYSFALEKGMLTWQWRAGITPVVTEAVEAAETIEAAEVIETADDVASEDA